MPAPASSRPAVRCRVVIVDDHVVIIEMLRQIVDAVAGYKVVGHAEDSVTALELCSREQPDVIVLDLSLPPVSGLALLRQLRTACRRTRILVFSGYLRPAAIRLALIWGAHGLVEKVAAMDEFRQALLAVSSGRIYFSRAASEKIRQLVNAGRALSDPDRPLSAREKTVLRAIASGFSSKEISLRLGISVNTVVNHRTHLTKKTGRRGVAQLSRYAAELGLVDSDLGPVEL